MPLSPDQRVGAYRILGELGQGGMGTVYRAVHTLLDRPAAIKVLNPEFGHQPTVVARFLNEARATTAIRHPGIVEVYDYGYTEDGRAYIAMELLVGTTLAARIAQQGRVPCNDAIRYARRIAAPLAVAHERGVVHRDLKPDNVFLVRDPDGSNVDTVKLLDFGIAKVEAGPSAHTTIGIILGTAAYMSPEQCRGAADCDHRTDLYALGCVLFEMLAGRPPFGGPGLSVGDLIAAHLQTPAPDVRDHVIVPDAVARLIASLLAKDPANRPPHATAVIAELDRLVAAPQRVAPRRRVSGRAVVAAVALAACSASLALWLRSARRGSSAVEAPELSLPADEPVVDVRFTTRVHEAAPAVPSTSRLSEPVRVAAPPLEPEVYNDLDGAGQIGIETPVSDSR